jgi:CRP-like cAMP-binding protein
MLKNFPSEKIDRLCDELKGKFLSKKDCLFKAGSPIDNVYIVKHGTLCKTVILDLE